MDGGAWWAAVHGVAKSQTRLSDFTFTFHFHALEKAMASHSSVLAWRITGMGEPSGLPSLGSHRVEHDWSNAAAAAAAAAAAHSWVPLPKALSQTFSVVEHRHHYFLKLPRWYQWAVNFENHWWVMCYGIPDASILGVFPPLSLVRFFGKEIFA